MTPITIEPVEVLCPKELEALLRESRAAGMRFMLRLIDEWERGDNRFDREGEALFIARCDGAAVGTIGLNVDPFSANPLSGRVRRLYVAESMRRQGLAARLLQQVIRNATGRFDQLLVRADRPGAAAFFEHLNFRPATAEPDATHALVLPFVHVYRSRVAQGDAC